MKIALISDVHANLPALEAIEQDLRFQGADIVINLGDIIGYGPHPCQCLAKLRHIASVMIKGNHSLALTDTREAYRMNPNAKAGDEFSRRELSVDDIIYLAQLPLSLELPEYRICLTHGASWLHPEKMEYLEGILHAQGVINHTPQPLYFMGHSHIPEAYHRPNGHQKLETCDLNKPVPINYEDKYLINVGSVGQPRDGDPRACYGILNLEDQPTFTLQRVPYDIEQTQKDMEAGGLPRFLINRLASGN